MGVLTDMLPKVKKELNKISGGASKSGGKGSSFSNETKKIYDTAETVQSGSNSKNTALENWYKQLPYGFRFRGMDFYLPISPSNLNITTHFATNVISTMYGTVEEHSEQRYYDITITGTTGMSPRYYKEQFEQKWDSSKNPTKVVGRAGFPIKSKIGGNLGGFFKRTQALVQNTLNQVSDLLGDDDPSTGIDLQRTGYAAFHNFYKFLLLHKKVAVGQSTIGTGSKNLLFLNYKDQNQYNVAIQTFQLTRDASNPMLYNYHISMRAYNLQTVDSQDVRPEVGARLADLGLNGINTSAAALLANKARQAKNAAYSAIAAAKGFGA